MDYPVIMIGKYWLKEIFHENYKKIVSNSYTVNMLYGKTSDI